MKIDDKIMDEKTQYEGEEILPSDQSRIIGQAKFTYCPLDKAFEKTIQDQRLQDVEALKALKLEENKKNTKSIE